MSLQSKRLDVLRTGVRAIKYQPQPEALPRYYVAYTAIPGAEYVIVDFATGKDICTTGSRKLADNVAAMVNRADRMH